MKSSPVFTRFAPSPTGHLHVGGARTALFCWAFARRFGGTFVLRIEDTDAARSSDESAKGIMEDLAWLGIEWDEGPELRVGGRTIGGDPRGVGPFFQARRLALYNAHIERLVTEGKAYPAFESSEELEAHRKAAVAAKQTYRYNRASLEKVPDIKERLRRMRSGEAHVVRFFAPAEEIVVKDLVLGDVRIAPGELDDFVIRKADGLPTYHFAVVVDDETMGVTHVMRAQEHLANTPRHVALQKALGFRRPEYAHVPLIFNMDSTKMSKRDKAKVARKALKDARAKQSAPAITGVDPAELEAFASAENDSLAIAEAIARAMSLSLPEIEVADFRAAGYVPEAIINFLSLLGWNPGVKTSDGKDLEKFDMAYLAANFSVERIGKTSSKFDRVKLLSFNGDAIAALSDEVFSSRWRAWCDEFEPGLTKAFDDAGWALIARAVKPRAKTFRDGVKACAFAKFDDARVPIDDATRAKVLNADGVAMLREVSAKFAAIEWTPEAIHGVIEGIAKERGLLNDKGGLNVGPVAQPIRVAIAGVPVTPPLDLTLAALGKKRVLARMDACLK